MVDAVDLALLDALREDGRLSVSALAVAVGVSRANAYRRLDRLEADGVIRGFTVRVDPAATGRPLAVILLISVQQAGWQKVERALAAVEEVDYLAATTGEFDFLALVRVADVAALRDVVLERLHAIPGVVGTRTVFVLDERVKRAF
jgi:Lrp/AsnC family transcriptional regulator, leucine-responsive regulatory protein